MPTESFRRLTFVADLELLAALDDAKRLYYDKSKSYMLADLLRRYLRSEDYERQKMGVRVDG